MNTPENYIAHITNHNNKWIIQDLPSHLNNVANLCKKFADKFNAGSAGYLAGLYHDFGKYQPRFLDYIKSASGYEKIIKSAPQKVPHAITGATLLRNNNLESISNVIAGHHRGLYNYDTLIPIIDGDTTLTSISIPYAVDETINVNCRSGIEYYFWTKFLFSCLIDADRLDTEKFMSPWISNMRVKPKSLTSCKVMFDKYMETVENNSVDSEINQYRRQLRSICGLYTEKESGLYLLRAGTGSGKTLSSMTFALNNSVKHNKSRIIYVIPYINIIEQTSDNFRDIFGDVVLEHHSSVDFENSSKQKNRPSQFSKKLATENWDSSIIVTTFVQFAQSLFSNKTKMNRKLHNIINSVIIFDEVQLFNLEFLTPILEALEILSKPPYNCTILLMSATPPDFKLIKSNLDCVEIEVPSGTHLNKIKYHDLGSLSSVKDVSDKLVEHNKVLCVVNSRKTCYLLYKELKKKNCPHKLVYLSNTLCGVDKSARIAYVKELLNTDEKVIVVSTSLIEAGVDLDFPVVYRQMIGIDSIIQTAGRCNRERKLDSGDVYVFRLEGTNDQHVKMFINAHQSTINSIGKFGINDKSETEYFKHLYAQQSQKVDQYNICKKINSLEFEDVSDIVYSNLIKDYYVSVIAPIDDYSKEIVNRIDVQELTFKDIRSLQRYIVNVPEKVLEDVSVEQVSEELFILTNPQDYDFETGLAHYSNSVY